MKGLTARIKQGYTMIEMLVVMSIIVIMSVALFANYREIGDQGRVSSWAGKVREDLYLAQNYSLSGRSNKSDIPNGWGIYFNRNLNKYIIFSDLNDDKQYTYPTKLLIHGTEWTSGATFTDSSQAANVFTVNNGSNVNDPTQVNGPGMPPLYNGYWQFYGSGGSLTTPRSTNFDFGSGDFAMDMWVLTDLTGNNRYILSKGGATKVYELYKNTDDKIKFVIYDSLLSAYTLLSSSAISASTSVNIAVNRRGNLLSLFVNGSVASTTRMTGTVNSGDGDDVVVGADNDGSSSSWYGRIDEVRISKGNSRWREKYNTPTTTHLTDDEFFREVKLPPGLVFDYLRLNGATTTELNIFFDLSPNKNTRPTYLMYGNANSGDQSAQIVINNAGTAGTGQAGDTPQTLTIDKSGAINWTN